MQGGEIIDRHRVMEILQRHRLDRTDGDGAGVVDEYVDRAEVPARVLDEVVNALAETQVAGPRQHTNAALGEIVPCALDFLRIARRG